MKQNNYFSIKTKIYKWCLINYKKILISTYSMVFIFLVIYAVCNWGEEADFYSDNFIIEITVGVCFSILPILIGVGLGKKIATDLQYYKFRKLLSELKSLRE
jgi:hypothetical protein